MNWFMKGWRTLATAGTFVLGGLVAAAGQIDMTPVVAFIVKDPEMIGVAMVGVGLLFGMLRYLTSTPITSTVPLSQVDEAPEDFTTVRQKTDAGE